jgi:HEPN domain-containing protein
MSDKFDLVRGWLVKAHSDLTTGNLVADGDGPYDTGCFHAQQAIEKALKALLALHEQPIPRTHDLEELQHLCLQIAAMPELAKLDLTEASDYAVQVRYDLEFWPSQAMASDALLLAERVLALVTGTLPPDQRPVSPAQPGDDEV